MAYELGQEEEENQEQSQGAQQLGAETGIITGDEQRQQNTQQGTGNYTNLQSYIDQNQPAQFGKQFSGRVGETVDAAERGQQEAGTEFRQKADASSVKPNEDIINEAASDPTKVVSDQNKLQAFRTQQNARYTGPQNLSSEESLYSKAYSPTNQAQSEAKTAQTTSGQKALLKQYYGGKAGRHNYSGGEQNLDQILIGMDPNARAQLSAQQQRAGQAGKSFDTLQDSLNRYAQDRSSETAQAAALAASRVGGAKSQFQQGVTGRVNQQLADRDATVARINAAIKNRQGGALSDSDRAMLGLDFNQPLYNIGKSGDVVSANKDANINTLATPEEYAKANAYSTLANEENTFLTGKPGTGPLLNTNQDLAALQRQKAAEWQAVQSRGGGAGDEKVFYDYTAADPWYADDRRTGAGSPYGRAYNIFNEPNLEALINSSIASAPNDAPLRQRQLQEIEGRRQMLKDRYGALDMALRK